MKQIDLCEKELTDNRNLFNNLSESELDFVLAFLKSEGNLKALQRDKNMSYQTAKKRLVEVLKSLRLKDSGSPIPLEKNLVGYMSINESDSDVTKLIKEKLNESGGHATIKLLRGDSCEIWFDSTGKGLVSPKIPPANQLIWEAFDAAVDVVIQNGGKAIKGNARAGRLGSVGLPLDSVEGYIAHKVHGMQPGETAFGPGFVICAVLDWVGVCKNERGYLSIKHNT